MLQAGWKNVGINVEAQPTSTWATYLAKLSKGNKGSGDQLFRMRLDRRLPVDGRLPLSALRLGDVWPTGSSTFYSNTQVDQLITQARDTADATQRYNLYAQAEKLILADVPVIPIYFYRDFRVSNTQRIGGFNYNPMGFIDMWKVWVK